MIIAATDDNADALFLPLCYSVDDKATWEVTSAWTNLGELLQ